jgi:hypothetical protein
LQDSYFATHVFRDRCRLRVGNQAMLGRESELAQSE